MEPLFDIDIVIVNWNSGALLRECLMTLAQSRGAERLGVVVVDNDSTDHSADGLSFPPLKLNLIRNATNLGFAAACNQGASTGHARHILFLNPDMRVERETLAHALAYLDDAAHADVGIVGARLTDGKGQTSRTCARRPTARMLLLRTFFFDRLLPALVPPHFLFEWDHADTRVVDQVMGAFLMIRRSLFDALGGFDERFFVYYEDLDLCLRAAGKGYRVVHLAESVAMHHAGGTTAAIKDRRFSYEATSRVLFTAKYFGKAIALLLIVLISAIEIPLRAVHALFRHSPRDGWLVLRGGGMFWAALPRTLRSIKANAAPRDGK